MLNAQSTAARFSAAAEILRRKPLYLATRATIRVTAEAECLVLRGTGSQVRRFPVARLDRIVCNRHADWSGEALALCLARGITVTWLGADGRALGDCSPRLAEPSTLHAALESYLEMPRWTASYGNWLRRRRMALLIRWARGRLAAGTGISRDQWETLKREFVYKGTMQPTLTAELPGWCHALVVARLKDAGLHTRYWGYDGEALELAEDLSALLWAGMNLDWGTLMGAAREPKAQAMALEAAMDGQIERIRDHLAHLRRHVAQALDSWL